MQTFLPYADFLASAKALDQKRLGKQRVETIQVLGDPLFHRSHQSALLRKDPSFYRPLFGPDVPDDLPYVWPSPDL